MNATPKIVDRHLRPSVLARGLKAKSWPVRLRYAANKHANFTATQIVSGLNDPEEKIRKVFTVALSFRLPFDDAAAVVRSAVADEEERARRLSFLRVCYSDDSDYHPNRAIVVSYYTDPLTPYSAY